MQGVEQGYLPTPYRALAAFEKGTGDVRREYARGRLEIDGEGRAVVRLYANNSSGVLSSVAWANGFAVLPPMTAIAPGDMIDFLPFSELTT
jgi:molybdopterin molybdotransferase